MDANTALLQTVDFFTPIVDDPHIFGQIAAANSLSDIYAMGGRPLTALNIVAFPSRKLPPEVLVAILQGGREKVQEAGAVIIGGHTIDDPEPKYGLSVTGIARPEEILTKAGARPGDVLVLTKPLGTGVLATAARAGLYPAGVAAAITAMTELNRAAAAATEGLAVHACTDITGFGLLGHLYEMAVASKVDVEVDSKALPLLPEAEAAAAMGLVPGGAYANRAYLTTVTFSRSVPEPRRDLCFDPQTSGGLLISVPENRAEQLLTALISAGVSRPAVVARIIGAGKGDIYVT